MKSDLSGFFFCGYCFTPRLQRECVSLCCFQEFGSFTLHFGLWPVLNGSCVWRGLLLCSLLLSGLCPICGKKRLFPCWVAWMLWLKVHS